MKIQTAILCDAANVREGMLNVLSGGISRVYSRDLPSPLGVTLALLVEVDSEQMDLPHELTVQVHDPKDEVLGRAVAAFQRSGSSPLRLEPGESILLPVVLDLRMIGTKRRGRHRIRVRVDESDYTFLTLYLQHPDELLLPPIDLGDP